MGFQKQGNFKVLNGADLEQKLESLSISVNEMMDNDHCFSSKDITINGHARPQWRIMESNVGDYFGKLNLRPEKKASSRQLAIWDRVSTRIPGLVCPYCHSQAYRTDHPNVAVCGGCPSWYFYYLEMSTDLDSPPRKLKIVNGELVEVNDGPGLSNSEKG